MPIASLASQVFVQLPKCVHNSIDAQLKHGAFLLAYCHCHAFSIYKNITRNLLKYRILLNRFKRRTGGGGMGLSRFRFPLVPYKKRATIASYVLIRVNPGSVLIGL